MKPATPSSDPVDESRSLDIYCIAIGGTGMAPLACLLQAAGHRVRGSDGPLYPPMSTLLERAGIEPLVGYDAERLAAGPTPDLVVVGNAVPRHNPEAEAVERLGWPRISMPEALGRFFLSQRAPLVVAGTHGKTTTTAMASWVLDACDRDPGYLIGGVPLDLDESFRIGTGDRFVIEGDEYNAAYFDRGPKFLHYQPHTLILTSVEHDHVDLYADAESLRDAFRQLIALVPAGGRIAACGDDPEVRDLFRGGATRAEVVFYGLDPENDVRPAGTIVRGDDGTHLDVAAWDSAPVPLHLRLSGEHNLQNALGVWAALVQPDAATDRAGDLEPAELTRALGSFRGVARRQQVLGTHGGITVIDDFAHHPTAIGKTLDGLRQLYPGRRLWSLFEPRSLTAGRSFLADAYRDAFAHADGALIAPIHHHDRLDDAERLDLDALVADLRTAGVDADALPSTDAVLAAALERAAEGDVFVTMSSGSFDGLPQRLLAALDTRSL